MNLPPCEPGDCNSERLCRMLVTHRQRISQSRKERTNGWHLSF